MEHSVYFAADTAENAASYLQQKTQEWFRNITVNNYLSKIKKSWAAYHGTYYSNSHEITFGGEQGELVNLAVNHYSNLCTHMLNMVTGSRPSFQCRAINTDRKSKVQAELGNGLLEYYMREKRLERNIKSAVEYAITLGSGFVKMEWNSTRGEINEYLDVDPSEIASFDENDNPLDEDGNVLKPIPIYDGDVDFTTLSPFDVAFDPTKESPELHEWVVVRTFVNRYNLREKYPEYADEIMKIGTKDAQSLNNRISLSSYSKTEDIPVYELFHIRTEAKPEGRYMMYLNNEVILEDTDMPYRSLPIYRIAPRNILGTPYGYTSMWDILPLQDAVNSLYSTIMTNNNAFGVQNILNPQGNNIKVNSLEGGLNFIEYNGQVGKPEPLQLTATAPETYNFLSMLEKTMETISGVNAVARGNPESSLRSGTALALVQSQALQFMSGLQQSYIQLLEDVGTGLINILKDFADAPRIASIAGISNTTKMVEFKSSDLNSINRVVVDVGNALAQCLEKGTEVLMYDGSVKKVEDIKLGELVMGPDSEPRTVGNVNIGTEKMYKIRPKNKKLDVEYGCNESHILTLKYCSDDSRYNAKKGDILDITVRDYLKLPKRQQRLLQGFTTSVEFKEKELSMPAYILGTWLGDGSKDKPSITTIDEEIEKEWRNYAKSIGMDIRVEDTNNRSKTYNITSGIKNGRSDRNIATNELRELEVLNNKHIPNYYLINSTKNRLELLAGLIDTDGSLVDQTFVFTQKCEKLTDQVVFLAKSLGFKVTKTLVEREYNGKPADIFKVNIGGDTHRIPTRLKRKQAIKKEKQKNWNNYGIEVVEQEVGTYYGFTLIEDPRFVLGNFSVTHNTAAGRSQIAENLLQMGVITTPEKYLEILNTGNLKSITQGVTDELDTINSENEALLKGSSDVLAIATDHHAMHIREHRSVLSDPVLRLDADLVARTIAHIEEHINLLRTTSPDLLSIIGEQPLAPVGGSPINPMQQGGIPGAQGASQPMQGTPMQQAVPGMPQPAQPPEIAGQEQPQTPEELMNMNLGQGNF